MTDHFKYLPEKCVANRWGISSRTLQRWRWLGLGPPYMKIGGRVRYSLESIKEFEAKSMGKNSNSQKLTKQDLLNIKEQDYEPQHS